jgi:hypothetical protein
MAMPAAQVTCNFIFAKGRVCYITHKYAIMTMPSARALRYTPRYLLNSLFSMASKNLRYRSISASLWGVAAIPIANTT